MVVITFGIVIAFTKNRFVCGGDVVLCYYDSIMHPNKITTIPRIAIIHIIRYFENIISINGRRDTYHIRTSLYNNNNNITIRYGGPIVRSHLFFFFNVFNGAFSTPFVITSFCTVRHIGTSHTKRAFPAECSARYGGYFVFDEHVHVTFDESNKHNILTCNN
jgi:hypothetical protein